MKAGGGEHPGCEDVDAGAVVEGRVCVDRAEASDKTCIAVS